MTLNDLELRNSFYISFFSPNSIALLTNYVTVVEDRPIVFRKILYRSDSLPLLAISNPSCDSWATCFEQGKEMQMSPLPGSRQNIH